MLEYFGSLIVQTHEVLKEIDYKQRSYRDPADTLRNAAVGAFSFARALGFADDPLDPNTRRVGSRVYKLGTKVASVMKSVRMFNERSVVGPAVPVFPDPSEVYKYGIAMEETKEFVPTVQRMPNQRVYGKKGRTPIPKAGKGKRNIIPFPESVKHYAGA